MLFLHFESLYFLKYLEQSEYFTLFWLAIVGSEYELEFIFRKIKNMLDLSNFKLSSLPIIHFFHPYHQIIFVICMQTG